jgi:signal transduction histidine kinase
VHSELDLEVEAVESFFWVYVGINVVVAALLLTIRRWPLGLIQWAVFSMILVDGLFLSALTLVTGGYQSFLYWLFLGLIVRSALSVPRATSQILLNLTIITCYVLAGIIDISIARNLEDHFRAEAAIRHLPRRPQVVHDVPARPDLGTAESRTTNRSAPETAANPPASLNPPIQRRSDEPSINIGLPGALENPAEPLFVRLMLLLLMTVCAYGVQVLLDRQRQVEEEAREFGAREGQLRSAGRLAAEFAHQIKNPLAIINNALYSLQRALREGRTNVDEQLRMIQEEVERSDRIITQIMDYAQLTEGRVEKLDAIEELDRAVDRVFPPAADFPVQVHREYAASFPPLLMQRRHFCESLVNVLQNAREALNGHKGAIWIHARCRSDYTIEISIRDNGPGIAPDKIERIFEPYYTTKEKGTGLGLASVKHNVELYGGRVQVESELGKGTCFILSFPAKTLIQIAKLS